MDRAESMRSVDVMPPQSHTQETGNAGSDVLNDTPSHGPLAHAGRASSRHGRDPGREHDRHRGRADDQQAERAQRGVPDAVEVQPGTAVDQAPVVPEHLPPARAVHLQVDRQRDPWSSPPAAWATTRRRRGRARPGSGPDMATHEMPAPWATVAGRAGRDRSCSASVTTPGSTWDPATTEAVLLANPTAVGPPRRPFCAHAQVHGLPRSRPSRRGCRRSR